MFYSRVKTRWQTAFTLIELLIVISIILILGGLLFPVFSSARAEAKRSACVSNLAQIHRAVALYMVDSDDHYPVGKDCLDLYAPAGYSESGLLRLQNTLLLPVLLHSYTKNNDIFRCPEDSGALVLESGFPLPVPLTPTAFDQCGLSYEYHTALGFDGVAGTALQNVTGVNLAEDLAGHWHGTGGITKPGDSQSDFYQRRWSYRYNVVYADGHVKFVDFYRKEASWREN